MRRDNSYKVHPAPEESVTIDIPEKDDAHLDKLAELGKFNDLSEGSPPPPYTPLWQPPSGCWLITPDDHIDRVMVLLREVDEKIGRI